MSIPGSEWAEHDWIKVDLHIHTLDDPKDVIDYSAHQLLERARALGFGVLAITLHDAVFDRPEVFADAAAMGILLVPAAEVRLQGADVIVLNVTAEEIDQLKDFDDLRQLRGRRGDSIFTFAPHPFYVLGGSIGPRLLDEIDCFDAIELCHFHKGLLNPNRSAARVARKFGKPLIATSDAHRLHAFGRHYTSIPRPKVEAASSRLSESETRLESASTLTPENVFAALRSGRLRLTSPPASIVDLVSAIYFIFLAHPFRLRHRCPLGSRGSPNRRGDWLPAQRGLRPGGAQSPLPGARRS
jgi:predicted metal-dependent phosphoesterase TrpH